MRSKDLLAALDEVSLSRFHLRAVLVQGVAHGQLSLSADGSFTYDPQGFSGSETFTYQIDDGTGISNTTTVTLRINTIPVAHHDEYEIDEDVSRTVTAEIGVAAIRFKTP